MEELDFNKLDQAFDKCCVKAVQANPELLQHGAELLVFAEHHPKRPVVMENVRKELRAHYRKRNSYRDHNRFKKNAQLIVYTIANMFMHAIKAKRDQDNLSQMEKIRLANAEQKNKDMEQLIREVPEDGETEEAN